MGLSIPVIGNLISGSARAATDVVEVFRPNAEGEAVRAAAARAAALAQFGAEFRPTRSRFDAVVDGINRLPRPAMALGTIALFGWAMSDPIGFAARMQGIALIPEPMWWLMGAIVSFYFGARELSHVRNRAIAEPAAVEAVARSMARIEAIEPPVPPLKAETPGVADTPDAELDLEEIGEVNPELAEFLARARNGHGT